MYNAGVVFVNSEVAGLAPGLWNLEKRMYSTSLTYSDSSEFTTTTPTLLWARAFFQIRRKNIFFKYFFVANAFISFNTTNNAY
jgi:hypothetical protein